MRLLAVLQQDALKTMLTVPGILAKTLAKGMQAVVPTETKHLAIRQHITQDVAALMLCHLTGMCLEGSHVDT
ncbi:hypothetical protein EBT16_01685 [bacterium]|nr:hypothetical protein [bacterium]